jgi:hypothetical protein
VYGKVIKPMKYRLHNKIQQNASDSTFDNLKVMIIWNWRYFLYQKFCFSTGGKTSFCSETGRPQENVEKIPPKNPPKVFVYQVLWYRLTPGLLFHQLLQL